MKSWTLIKQNLRFYRRTHLGIVLGVAVSTAIMVGALIVGDSVKYTLKRLALLRLGNTQLAMASTNRYFRSALAEDLELGPDVVTAPILQMRGTANNTDETVRVNNIQVLGVDERFWSLAAHSNLFSKNFDQKTYGTKPVINRPTFDLPSEDEAVINERLANQMDVRAGDKVILHLERTSLLPRDAPMSIGVELPVGLSVTVKAVASDSSFGNFSLQASQIPPFNAFVPLAWLQEKMELLDRANVLLLGGGSSLDKASADAALRKHWKLADADLEQKAIPEQNALEVRTDRIFLDAPVADAVKRAIPEAYGVLTYFVNEIRLGDRATPYSMVAAIETGKRENGKTGKWESGSGGKEARGKKIGNGEKGSVFPDDHKLPPDMRNDEILINDWLARDLKAEAGDVLEITYFVFGPMRKLEERRSSFRVRDVIPIEGAAADPALMPAFPGLSGIENCRDWDPGIAIDLKKIRKKEDEGYWNQYRGTPKAFITLEAGQDIWSNRFGVLTALRYPPRANAETAIMSELDPASVGLIFHPVREQAMAASTQGVDFGQLFLGLSFFLIAAALLLTGLLFVFGIEQRSEEMGTLLALGFRPQRVRSLLLLEGGILAIAGGLLGMGIGVLYTKAVLYALSTVWRGAVTTSGFYYHAKPLTLVIGTAAGILIALLTIWIMSLRQARRPVRELLSAVGTCRASGPLARGQGRFVGSSRFPYSLLISAIFVIAALIILLTTGTGKDAGAAGVFFGAGALLLIGCLALSHALLSYQMSRSGHHSLIGIGLRNSSRRRYRSLATIGLLACGSFLVIAVGINRHGSMKDSEKRSSGTGGFALYGESALPVLLDLNSEDGRKEYSLGGKLPDGVEFVPLRVYDGDDASCLNLNRPQNPRLMGIRPEELQKRGAFTFTETVSNTEPWLLLESSDDDNVINAIGDQNTITWSVGKSVGDTLMYTDERGQTFHIRIVGAVASSILQGSFVISEDEFTKRFPSESGYRAFFIDAPLDKVSEVSRTLTSALKDSGLELTSTVQRLAEFNTVQNTYLSIFQSLGGLALLLGSVGLGIVVMRNVMERRSELALLRAVGFRLRSLKSLILSEHWLLLLLGLLCGVISGLVAVLPALRSPGVDVPYTSLIVTLFGILLNGALWVWIATRLALRGPLLAALRDE